MVNKDVYNTDEQKIAFILSYMTEKEALQWKELSLELMTNDDGDLIFPDYRSFLASLKNAFKPEDRTQDAMNKLTILKQGNRAAEELVTEFRLLAGQAGLSDKTESDNMHLIRMFQSALNGPLAKKILFGEEVPRTIEGWFRKAIQYDVNYRMALAIMGKTPKYGKPNYGWGARNPNRETRDPNAMDIDSMSQDKRTALMRRGACFKCEETGHLARDCTKKGWRSQEKKEEKKTEEKKKWSAKDIHAQIRSLTKEERQELMDLQIQGDEDF
jgi:Zinc knuckle/Retrotransposon gag protein